MIEDPDRPVKTEMWELSGLSQSGTGALIHEESHLARLHNQWHRDLALRCLGSNKQTGQHVLRG